MTLSGSNFAGATEVLFGDVPAQSFRVLSPTTIEAIAPGSSTTFKFGKASASSVDCVTSTECVVRAPAGAPGKASVVATVNGVSSKKTSAVSFTYE